MPLDSSTYTPVVERIATKDEFYTASPRQRLAMLSYALRHMPDSHSWNFCSTLRPKAEAYQHCGTSGCAIGLSIALWNGSWEAYEALDPVGPWEQSPISLLFRLLPNEMGTIYGVRPFEVAPSMVADAIDRYLLTGDPRS